MSAYVYGNVLVLGAVVENSRHAVRSGEAVVVVLATMFTTYLAHVLANDVAGRIDLADGERAAHLREELRDALPILTAGVPAAALLALGALGVLGATTAQLLAAGIELSRLAGTGWNVQRLSGAPASRRALWEGVSLALAGSIVAVLKLVLLH